MTDRIGSTYLFACAALCMVIGVLLIADAAMSHGRLQDLIIGAAMCTCAGAAGADAVRLWRNRRG